MNRVDVNVDCIKVYVVQRKNGIILNECKELDDYGSYKNYYMWNSSTCHC